MQILLKATCWLYNAWTASNTLASSRDLSTSIVCANCEKSSSSKRIPQPLLSPRQRPGLRLLPCTGPLLHLQPQPQQTTGASALLSRNKMLASEEASEEVALEVALRSRRLPCSNRASTEAELQRSTTESIRATRFATPVSACIAPAGTPGGAVTAVGGLLYLCAYDGVRVVPPQPQVSASLEIDAATGTVRPWITPPCVLPESGAAWLALA